MGKKTKKIIEDNDKLKLESVEDNYIIKYPRICALGFDNKKLKDKNTRNNIYFADLGKVVTNIPTNNFPHYLKLGTDLALNIPNNLHEYQILGIELNQYKEIDYADLPKNKTKQISPSEFSIKVQYPQTALSPKSLFLDSIKETVTNLFEDSGILIVFASSFTKSDYIIQTKKAGNPVVEEECEYNIFGFCNEIYNFSNLSGVHQHVIPQNGVFRKLLEKYLDSFKYEVVFDEHLSGALGKRTPDPNFTPLLCNDKGNITSFAKIVENGLLIVLPSSNQCESIFMDLLQEVLPEIKPDLFPENCKNAWLLDSRYHLPNTKALIEEEQKLLLKHRIELDTIKNKIKINNDAFSYLHKLLTETGEELVDAVKTFLSWLGFDNVEKSDDNKKELLEEDLTFTFDGTIYLIEIKGIIGTSKDYECSQIDKIVTRRMKKFKKTNYKGVYIVNHQRHLPPHDRETPPFKKEQIQDAEHIERLLLTTWDFFKIYNLVQTGLLSKTWVQSIFKEKGYQDFLHNSNLYIGTITELVNAKIGILQTVSNIITVGDSILAIKNNEVVVLKIEGIQINGNPIETITNIETEIGIKVDKPIKMNFQLYLKP